jgi:phospholipid/cholesterol/gamma-HCH transport system substrate-binding protein
MKKEISKKVQVGAFIIIGVLFFTIALFVISSNRNLFSSTFQLNSVFLNVSGLQEGGSVNFAGIKVGIVRKITIKSGTEIIVLMEVDNKVREFIKKDSKAAIVSEGLIGNKIIEITSGGISSKSVSDGDILESIVPISAEDIFKSLKDVGEKAAVLTKDLSEIVGKVNSGEGTLGQLINNKSLYYGVDSTMRGFARYSGEIGGVIGAFKKTIDIVNNNMDELTKDLRVVTKNISEITMKINSNQSVVGTLLTDTVFANDLKEIVSNANIVTKNLEEGSFGFTQNMEALKHNFFFKGYFEDLGYWDKADFEKNYLNKQKELKKNDEELKKLQKKLDELNNIIEQKEKEIQQKK